MRFYPVAPVFVNYYSLVDGPRTLGQAISPLLQVNGVPAQYFEKARLEDRRSTNTTGNPAFDFEYGLLVDEMKAINSPRPVGGERSNVTYATINQQSAENLRVPVPPRVPERERGHQRRRLHLHPLHLRPLCCPPATTCPPTSGSM